MFIAQIKSPIHHSLSCGWSGSVCAVLCSSAGCLKLQRLMVALSQAPAKVTGRETKLSKAHGCYKACWIKQTSYCDNIRSRGWRGSTLSSIRRGLSSVEGPVSRFIDAAVVQEQLALFGACKAAYGPRCFSQHALDRRKTGHDTARRPSAFAPCDHMAHCTRTTPTPPGLTAARVPHRRHHPWPGWE